MIVLDSTRKMINLGPELYRGGEGAIYPVQGQPGLIAKIYVPAPPRGYDIKLAWMKAHPPQDPSRTSGQASIAWPIDLLYGPDNRFTGYVMPHIRNTVPLLVVFNPRSRARTLPGFDWRYLHRAARNLASALAALHARGYVVGDLNETNILITPTALVTLIDTDSFQVQEQGAARIITYPCPVGKPEYTPPELQGKVFRDMLRQPEHDCFGLGVLIFQLLMGGSHPFRAQWLGSGDPPAVEERIARGWFPHLKAPHGPVAPPPNTPALQTLHPELALLTQRCFVDGHYNPRLRPSPGDWEHTLAQAEQALVKCSNGHFYANHLRACPRCGAHAIRTAGRISLAVTPAPVQTGTPVIAAGPAPSQRAAPPAVQVAPTARMQAAWQTMRSRTTHAPPRVRLPVPLVSVMRRVQSQLEQTALVFWAGWILASFMGWIAGYLASSLSVLWAGGLAANAVQGLLIGLAQWLVLRRRVSEVGWWIPATALSYAIGLWIDQALGTASLWPATACLVSLAQAITLWQRMRGAYAPWWILANIAGWVLGFTLSRTLVEGSGSLSFQGILIAAPLNAIVTGLALIWLLRASPGAGTPGLLRLHIPWRVAVAAMGFAMLGIAAASIGLRPCGWLDTPLKLSKCVRTLAQGDAGWGIAFSPRGALLAAESYDHTIRIWRVSDGTLQQTLSGQPVVPTAMDTGANLAFSADGTTLTALAGDTVRVWQVQEGGLVRAQRITEVTRSPRERVTSAQLSPGGALLALAVCDAAAPPLLCSSVEIRLWRTADGRFMGALKGHVDQVTSMAFSPDGSLLVSGSCNKFGTGEGSDHCQEGEILLWRVQDGKLLYEVDGHTDWVNSVVFSKAGDRFASGSADGSVQVWRTNGGARLSTLQHSAPIQNLAFAPDGAVLVAASNPLAVWQLPDGTLARNSGPPDTVLNVALAPDGSTLAALSGDLVILWGLR